MFYVTKTKFSSIEVPESVGFPYPEIQKTILLKLNSVLSYSYNSYS